MTMNDPSNQSSLKRDLLTTARNMVQQLQKIRGAVIDHLIINGSVSMIEVLIARVEELEKENNQISEMYDGRPVGFYDHLRSRALELVKDYPYTQNDPFEWLWAITSSLVGTSLACDDWYKESKELHSRIEELEKENQEFRFRLEGD